MTYAGEAFVLMGVTDETAPGLRVEYDPPTSFEEAYLLLRRFMSALAWATGQHVRELTSAGGGVKVRFGRTGAGVVITSHFFPPTLTEPTDPRTLLALALYREALNVNSLAYSFLSFFKIVNVVYETGNQQKTWIESVLPHLASPDVQTRLAQLSMPPVDLANYLYESGRCAVAHAFQTPVVDPDNLADDQRLREDLPVMRALAEILIEQHFGLKR